MVFKQVLFDFERLNFQKYKHFNNRTYKMCPAMDFLHKHQSRDERFSMEVVGNGDAAAGGCIRLLNINNPRSGNTKGAKNCF